MDQERQERRPFIETIDPPYMSASQLLQLYQWVHKMPDDEFERLYGDSGQTYLSPEQQLRNVAQSLLNKTTPTRQYNGRGRPESYLASKAEIAQHANQLAEMIIAYLDGEMKPSVDDGLPF